MSHRKKNLRTRGSMRTARSGTRFQVWISSGPTRTLFLLLGIAGALAGGWLTVRDYYQSGRAMRLRHLEVEAGKSLSPALVREWTGIREGIGLFEIDIGSVRNRLVAEAPQVKNIRISRILPDTMIIRIIERQPLARLGRDGRLVVDEDGLVFVWHGGLDTLPCLVGGDRHRGLVGSDGIIVGGDTREIHPGRPLGGMVRAALQVLRLTQEPAWHLPVVEVDVSARDHLRLLLADRREITIAWEGMQRDSDRSRYRLKRRMSSLLQVLSDPASRDCRYFDATVDDQRIIGRLG